MFTKYDKSGDGTLTLTDLFELMHGNRNVMDPFGVSMMLQPRSTS